MPVAFTDRLEQVVLAALNDDDRIGAGAIRDSLVPLFEVVLVVNVDRIGVSVDYLRCRSRRQAKIIGDRLDLLDVGRVSVSTSGKNPMKSVNPVKRADSEVTRIGKDLQGVPVRFSGWNDQIATSDRQETRRVGQNPFAINTFFQLGPRAAPAHNHSR